MIVLIVLRHPCQQVDFASGQQEITEEDVLKEKKAKQKAEVSLQVQLYIVRKVWWAVFWSF